MSTPARSRTSVPDAGGTCAGSPTHEISPSAISSAPGARMVPSVSTVKTASATSRRVTARRRTSGRRDRVETRRFSSPPSTVTSTVPSVSRPPTNATAPGMKPPSSSNVSDPRFSSTSSLMRKSRTRSPTPTSASGRVATDGAAECEPGIGLPCGHVAGSPSSSTSRASTSSEITCSQRPASRCTLCHSSPMTSTRSRSARRCLRTTFSASARPLSVSESRRPSRRHIAVLNQPIQHFGDGRCRAAQALGDARLDHRDALLGQPEHRLEVLLDRRVVLLGCVATRGVVSHRGSGRPRAARRARGCGRRSRTGPG